MRTRRSCMEGGQIRELAASGVVANTIRIEAPAHMPGPAANPLAKFLGAREESLTAILLSGMIIMAE